MIDFDEIPAEITEHIKNFKIFLNMSWDHVIYKIMDNHNWDDDGEFIDDWMQVNWELLVERELLGPNHCLSQFSTTHLSKNIFHSNRQPDYVVLAHSNKDLIDIKTQKILTKNRVLRFFSLKTINHKYNSFAFGPPFDIAGLVDDATKELYNVPFDQVKFYMHDFGGYDSKQYYLK